MPSQATCPGNRCSGPDSGPDQHGQRSNRRAPARPRPGEGGVEARQAPRNPLKGELAQKFLTKGGFS